MFGSPRTQIRIEYLCYRKTRGTRRPEGILCHDAQSGFEFVRSDIYNSTMAGQRYHDMATTMRVDTQAHTGEKARVIGIKINWQKYLYIQRDSSKFEYRTSRSYALHKLHSGYLTCLPKSYDIMLIRPSIPTIHILHPQTHIIVIRAE